MLVDLKKLFYDRVFCNHIIVILLPFVFTACGYDPSLEDDDDSQLDTETPDTTYTPEETPDTTYTPEETPDTTHVPEETPDDNTPPDVSPTGPVEADSDKDGDPDDTDCDDTNPNIYTSQKELCDGVDQNCNSEIDEGVKPTWYLDNDDDDFGRDSDSIEACSAPSALYVSINGDCDDNSYDVNPDAIESCNGIDDNCDTQIDEDATTIFYIDSDSDGFGDINSIIYACSMPSGYSTNSSDCDDGASSIYPNANELCDDKDTNCDGELSSNEKDIDDDGFTVCTNDCDDNNETVYPNADELCDALDNDCNSEPDEDLDNDGFFANCIPIDDDSSSQEDCNDSSNEIHPLAQETCNGIDDNCFAGTDEYLEGSGDIDSDGINDCVDTCPIWVSELGDDAQENVGTFNRPYKTIQVAIDAFDNAFNIAKTDSSCNIIMVKVGRYNESINFNGKNVSLLASTSSDGIFSSIEDHILDGNGLSKPVVSFEKAEGNTAVLSGFLIQNSDISTNQENNCGAGIYIKDSAPSVLNNILSHNKAVNGAGICIMNPNITTYIPIISNNQILHNEADKFGGGLYVNSYNLLDLTNSTIAYNFANYGGGAYISQKSSVSISSSVVDSNEAIFDGGGIYSISSQTLKLPSAEVKDNVANNGGGIYVEAIEQLVIGVDTSGSDSYVSFFENNYAKNSGGAIYLYNMNLPFISSKSSYISANLFSGNISDNAGGAIASFDAIVTFIANSMSNNIADHDKNSSGFGGGVYCEDLPNGVSGVMQVEGRGNLYFQNEPDNYYGCNL